MSFSRRASITALVAVAASQAAVPAASSDPPAASSDVVPLRVGHPGGERGQLSAVQGKAVQGYLLVPDDEAYAKAKKRAEASAPEPAPTAPPEPEPLAPTLLASFQGQTDLNSTPSDSTGAIGPTRYIQLVNRRFGIYSRTSSAPISSGTLGAFTGSPGNVFDPQVIWDPTTQRFYYVADDVLSATDNRLDFGFSKTASPNSAADFCKYVLFYGAELPDYPKLGDNSNTLLIGSNVFGPSAFLRTDLAFISKPPAGTTCPAASSFTSSVARNLRNADGSVAWTPVPANQQDGSPTGYVTATRFPSGSFISVFNAVRFGGFVLGPARTLGVPFYDQPADATQRNSFFRLDTIDTRLTNSVSSIDPVRGSNPAIWTQHTTLGGAGAEVRWYEINPTPSTPVLFQLGKITSSSLYAFNGAISSDRRSNTTSKAYGGGMAITYNTSSLSQFPDIRLAAKLANNPVASGLVIKSSTDRISDFSCNTPQRPNICRWGDYAGATPDPASPSGQFAGQVWLTSQWASSSSGTFADWRTWIFAARP